MSAPKFESLKMKVEKVVVGSNIGDGLVAYDAQGNQFIFCVSANKGTVFLLEHANEEEYRKHEIIKFESPLALILFMDTMMEAIARGIDNADSRN